MVLSSSHACTYLAPALASTPVCPLQRAPNLSPCHACPLPSQNHAPHRLDRDIALAILEGSGIQPGSGYQLGASKVFLRAGQMAILDKQRTGAAPGLWGALLALLSVLP